MNSPKTKSVILIVFSLLLFVEAILPNDIKYPLEVGDKDTQKKTYQTNCSDSSHVTYIAAVLEYEPFNQWSEEGKGYAILRNNAFAIVDYAFQAKNQGAQILVTPEYGLQSNEMSGHTREQEFLTFTQYVPEPTLKFNPCSCDEELDYFEAMKILSCGARDNSMYLVANVAELYPCSNETVSMVPWKIAPTDNCPPEGYMVYNTQVVFDGQGAIIARYRKIHLFLEAGFTPGPPDDATAIFTTDFNVAFSLQICFDIMYEHPGYSNIKTHGIRDVAMSTAWVDQLPFELGDAIQNGWSRGLDSNLLVSGFHNPENYELGSGIYRGYMKQPPVYTFDKNSGNVLLVAPVTTVAASNILTHSTKKCISTQNSGEVKPLQSANVRVTLKSNTNEEDRNQVFLHQNISEFTRVKLYSGDPGEVLDITLCSYDQFCCDLKYQYSGNLTYYFIVLSGLSPVGGGEYHLGVQQCGVVWCKTSDYRTCALVELGLPDSDSFGPFKISSSHMSSDVVFPIGNTRDLNLIGNENFEFQKNETYSSVSTAAPVKDLLTAALYGRWFDRDR